MFISVLNVLRSFEEHRLQIIAGTDLRFPRNLKTYSQEGNAAMHNSRCNQFLEVCHINGQNR